MEAASRQKTVTSTEEFNSSVNVITAAAWSSGPAHSRKSSWWIQGQEHNDAMKFGDTGGSYPGWPTKSHSYMMVLLGHQKDLFLQVLAQVDKLEQDIQMLLLGVVIDQHLMPLTINTNNEYNGSSWTAGGDLNDAIREYAYATGAGPQLQV